MTPIRENFIFVLGGKHLDSIFHLTVTVWHDSITENKAYSLNRFLLTLTAVKARSIMTIYRRINYLLHEAHGTTYQVMGNIRKAVALLLSLQQSTTVWTYTITL